MGSTTLISSAFTALLNCAEVGRRNRILTNYRFLSHSLFFIQKKNQEYPDSLCYVLIIRRMTRVRGRSDFLLRYHGLAFHSKCLLVHKYYLLEHRNVVSR